MSTDHPVTETNALTENKRNLEHAARELQDTEKAYKKAAKVRSLQTLPHTLANDILN